MDNDPTTYTADGLPAHFQSARGIHGQSEFSTGGVH
jgi:hypothetical protein